MGQHEEPQMAWAASLLELGGELAATIDGRSPFHYKAE